MDPVNIRSSISISLSNSTNTDGKKGLQPIVEVESDILEEDEESDVSDIDVNLSEDDFVDEEDDDLFAAHVDFDEVSETVRHSLGGLNRSNEHQVIVSENRSDGREVREFGEGHEIVLESDDDLNDSDEDLIDLEGSNDEVQYPVFIPSVDFNHKINFTLGLKFPSNIVFRKALRHHAIENGYNYYFLHNKSKRITVYCAERCKCPWKEGKRVECKCKQRRKCLFKIHCKKLKGEETFQIKSLILEHVCGYQHVNPKVTSQYLAERYIEDWRDDPGYKLSAFMKRVRREVGSEVGYYKCYYARQRALKMIHGDASDEYKKVWEYAEAIRKSNPGSTAVVKVQGIENRPPLFQRMYICLQPCKEGFMAGCRPILGVDGAHLRGPYPGILLTAVGKDGNNNIFPVAWAVVETENAETWTWFLELLVNDISSVAQAVTWVHELEDDVTFMSDRQKGLLDAFTKVIPSVETRYCCRHIWSNFKLKFPGEVYRASFWKAARSSTKHEFEVNMVEIRKLNVEAFKYLNDIPVCHWSRHGFSTRAKSGMLLNNCCESFNNVLRDARAKPILSLMEWIRRYVMMRCCAKREGLQTFDGLIMPSVVKMVERGQKLVGSMRITQVDLYEFEVDHEGDSFVVHLEHKTCGCYRWSLLGIPCWHALACIAKRRLNYEDFVHPAYHVSTYAATYTITFHGMPGQKQWDKLALPEPLPPAFRVMSGRPSKKKRKKEKGEGKEQQVKRARKQNSCKNCGSLGHNKTTCSNTPKQKGPVNKGGRGRASTSLATTTSTSVAATTSITSREEGTKSNKSKTQATKGKKKKIASINALQGSQPSQQSCVSHR